jgi:hypothetical protein
LASQWSKSFLIQEVNMFGKRLFSFVVALSIIWAALFSRSHVSAGSDNVARGDVEATLHSWNTGVRAVFFTSGSLAAAQLDGFQRGRIIPAADGRHYCVEDWHVVLLSWVTGGDETFNYQDALADLSGITTAFILDGRTLSSTETPIVRRVVPLFGDIVNYGYAVGSILSPVDLGIGPHALTTVFTFASGSTETFTITFFVDPSGSGACVP